MAWATPSSSPASQGTGWRVRRGWSASGAGGGCGAPLCQGVLVGGHMLFDFFAFVTLPYPQPAPLSAFPRPCSRCQANLLNYHRCRTPTRSEIVRRKTNHFPVSLKARRHPAHSTTHVWALYLTASREQPSFEFV